VPAQQKNLHYNPVFDFSPMTGTIAAVLAAMAVTFFGLQFPEQIVWWFPVSVGLVGTAAVVVLAGHRHWPRRVIVFRAIAFLGPGLWSGGTILYGEFSIPSLLVFLAAATFFGVGGVVLLKPRPAVTTETGEVIPGEIAAPVQDDLYRNVAAHIAVALNLKALPEVAPYEAWPRDAGVTLHIEGPPGVAFGHKVLQDICPQLTMAWRQKPGCPVLARPSPRHQGAALLDITTKNLMGDPIPFPRDWRVTSILNDFSLGWTGSGQDFDVEVHQASAAIVATRGGGKTQLEHELTGQVAKTDDTIICLVDMNGGSVAAPWMLLVAEGKVKNGVIGAIANTPETALLLAQDLVRMAKARKSKYQSYMARNDTDKLPVNHEIPEVLVIVDEGGELFGEGADKVTLMAANLFRELQRLGRAVRINVVLSTQRGTSEYLPAQTKKLADLKIVGRVDDDDEIAYVLDWKTGLSAAILTHPGMWFGRRGIGSAIQLFKGFAMTPETIMEIVGQCEARRPLDIDPLTLEASTGFWAIRWSHPDVVEFMSGLVGGGVPHFPEFTPVDVGGTVLLDSNTLSASTALKPLDPSTFGRLLPPGTLDDDGGYVPLSNDPIDRSAAELNAALGAFDPAQAVEAEVQAQQPQLPPELLAEAERLRSAGQQPSAGGDRAPSLDIFDKDAVDAELEQIAAGLAQVPSLPDPDGGAAASPPPARPPAAQEVEPSSMQPDVPEKFTPGQRVAFIHNFVRGGAVRGRMTSDIREACDQAGVFEGVKRKNALNDLLTKMKDPNGLGLLEQDPDVYSRWWAREFYAGRVCE
jgi:hypothetical protein